MATASRANQHGSYHIFLAESKVDFLNKWTAPSRSDAKLDDFNILDTIGVGGFGRVRVAIKISNRCFYAIKILNKKQMVELDLVQRTVNEKRILQSINFPFIVELDSWFKDSSNIYLVMEFVCRGDLYNYIRKIQAMGESGVRFYGAQIVLALEYLQNLNIVHRDLKPDNLLIDNCGYLKLGDFGMAKHLEGRTYTVCGLPEFTAPEVYKACGHGKAVDWWSLGVLLHLMFTRYVPFIGPKRTKLCFRNPSFITWEFIDLVDKLLEEDPLRRYGNLSRGVADIKDHFWFQPICWIRMFKKVDLAPLIPFSCHLGSTENFCPYEYEDLQSDSAKSYAEEFADF